MLSIFELLLLTTIWTYTSFGKPFKFNYSMLHPSLLSQEAILLFQRANYFSLSAQNLGKYLISLDKYMSMIYVLIIYN
ncbi:MAG: hypothetical protein B6D53_04820 [Candidatus Omnitrophica bacterium 4484_49]|nr:MAG: hypothetical protein B6D53_04820 [Candidatus Omnitrophica bacterium 4484_49]